MDLIVDLHPSARRTSFRSVLLLALLVGLSACGSIFDAIDAGDGQRVVELARSGDLEARNRAGNTPLMMALYRGDEELARKLLDIGATPNATSNSGATPLMIAAAKGQKELVEALLDAGASLEAKDGTGATALFFAARKGELSTVKLLLQRGADPTIRVRGDSAAERALAEGYVETSMYLSLSPDRREGDAERVARFFEAAMERDEEELGRLLAEGIDVNARDALGDGALGYVYATEDGCCPRDVAALLFERGYRITHRDVLYLGHRIHRVAEARDLRTLRALKAAGWDPDSLDGSGETALTSAAADGGADVVRALLDMGASAQLTNDEGHTALFLAQEADNPTIANLLAGSSTLSEADLQARRVAAERRAASRPKKWRPAIVDRPDPVASPQPEPEPEPVCLGGGTTCGSGCCSGTCCRTPYGYECKPAIEDGLFTGCN